MKLPFDENLSPHLTEVLADLFPGSAHVHPCGLGNSDDSAIWEYARANGFTIVSKDSDFEERSVILGSPPKSFCFECETARTEKSKVFCDLLSYLSRGSSKKTKKLAWFSDGRPSGHRHLMTGDPGTARKPPISSSRAIG